MLMVVNCCSFMLPPLLFGLLICESFHSASIWRSKNTDFIVCHVVPLRLIYPCQMLEVVNKYYIMGFVKSQNNPYRTCSFKSSGLRKQSTGDSSCNVVGNIKIYKHKYIAYSNLSPPFLRVLVSRPQVLSLVRFLYLNIEYSSLFGGCLSSSSRSEAYSSNRQQSVSWIGKKNTTDWLTDRKNSAPSWRCRGVTASGPDTHTSMHHSCQGYKRGNGDQNAEQSERTKKDVFYIRREKTVFLL